MPDRPWIAAFERLMRERQGLKKQALAELGQFAPARISTLLNPPKPPKDWSTPDVGSLQALAEAFTKWDRFAPGNPRRNPSAPAVELWEFFVSDQQAAVLRAQAAHHAALIQPPADPRRDMIEKVLAILQSEDGRELAPPHEAAKRRAK